MTTPHLHPNTAKLLERSDAERQTAVMAFKWIPYTRAQRVLEKMNDLLHHPPTHRMPNLLVVGDSGNGKSVILQRYSDTHAPYSRAEDGQLRWPVLYMQAPPEPDEKRFYNVLLDQLGVLYGRNDRADHKQLKLIHVMRRLEVKMLVIDEIQHVLAGNLAKQRLFLNVLKYLSNELRIPLVCAGVRTAFNAIQLDEQLANRFEPIALPRWTHGDEYTRLLLSFEQLLPLKKPSNLIDEAVAARLLAMSEGTIGELAKILRLATIRAIDSGVERITLPLLGKLGHAMPSDRMRYDKALTMDV